MGTGSVGKGCVGTGFAFSSLPFRIFFDDLPLIKLSNEGYAFYRATLWSGSRHKCHGVFTLPEIHRAVMAAVTTYNCGRSL